MSRRKNDILKEYIKESLSNKWIRVNHDEILSTAKRSASNPEDVPKLETLHQNIAHMTVALKELETRLLRVINKTNRLGIENSDDFVLPLVNCIDIIKAMINESEKSIEKLSLSNKIDNHKIQAELAMKDSTKLAGKKLAESVYRNYSKSLKKKENFIEDYIRKTLNEEGILGKYVWPSAIKNHPFPEEPDTDIEELLYKELYNHFSGISPLSDTSISAIKQILDSGEYSNVFKRCSQGQALRGIRLPVSWLEKHAPEALENLPEERKDLLDWGDPVVIKPMTYTSKGKFGSVSSWTAIWEEAQRFSARWSANTVPVILHSDCSSGYFMQTWPFKSFKGGRYKEEFGIKKLNRNPHEKEILLFGNCIITAIEVNATKKDIEKVRSIEINDKFNRDSIK